MPKGDFTQEYNRLMSIYDYRGLATLLRNTNYKTDEARDRAYNMANRFEEEADITDKILEGASSNQRAAYNFVANGPRKSLDNTVETDIYSKQFSDAWNSMADENNIINVRFGTEKEYDNFISSLGGEDNVKKIGIKLGSNYNVSFQTNINDKIDVYKAINASGLKERLESVVMSTLYQEPGISKTNIPDLNVLNKNDRKLRSALISMNDVVNKANTEYTNLMDKSTPYILQTVVTGYMGEDDRQLERVFAAGGMDLQTYKEQRKLLEEKYNRLLQNKSLSQYNVYSMNIDNNGSQLLQKLDDNILKSQLDSEINLAMTEGRLHYSHASNGIMYGTMITIDQRFDKKGNPMDDYPERRFFVQDLFRSEAENSLRQDTQTYAQLEYAKHQSYGHIYRAKDGGKLEDWNGQSDSAVYTDEFGNKRYVSKAEALDIIDNDIITSQLIDFYKKANRKNNNGQYYTEQYYQLYGGNTPTQELLENHIKAKSLQVVAAKYGDPSSDYVKVKANKLASTIMRIVSQDLNFE